MKDFAKKYGLEKLELASKLEARNEIDRIIKEHDTRGVFNETGEDE